MKRVLMIVLMGMFVFACADTGTQSAPEAAPEQTAPAAKKPTKSQCKVDQDCPVEGAICVKPQAADYGFCLG